MQPKRSATQRLFLLVTTLGFLVLMFVDSANADQDTIFLRKRPPHGHDMIFIDNSPKSKNYSRFDSIDLSFRERDPEVKDLVHEFDSALWSRLSVKHFSSELKGLFGQWYQVYPYHGAFYLYDCCDGLYWHSWVITDSAIIPLESMANFYGSFALRDVQRESDSSWHLGVYDLYDSVTTSCSVERLPGKRPIYRWSAFPGGGESPIYLIPVASVRKFPIIVNYCEDQKEVEVDFDGKGGAKCERPMMQLLLPDGK